MELKFKNSEFFACNFNCCKRKNKYNTDIQFENKKDFENFLKLLEKNNIGYEIIISNLCILNYQIILKKYYVMSYSDNHNVKNLDCSLNSNISRIVIK